MNEEFTPESSDKHAEILSAVKKIQEQLGFLERKIDTLLNQGSGKPFQKPFSKPFRSFDRKGRGGHRDRDDRGGHGDRGRDRDRGPREFSDRPREDRPREEGRGERREFHPRKRKSFFRPGKGMSH